MRREPTSLRAFALAALARRERSPAELAQKLRGLARRQVLAANSDAEDAFSDSGTELVFRRSSEQGVCDEAQEREIQELLVWLAEQGFLSATRFVESRVASRSSRWGQVRIRHELNAHGLSLDETAAQALKDSELARATEVWVRRFGRLASSENLVGGGARERARQHRFLAARGFGSDVIRRVLSDRLGGDDQAFDPIGPEDQG